MKTHTVSVSVIFALFIAIALSPSIAADHETRYVGVLDEPCSMEMDEYGQLKLCYVPYKVVIDAGSVVMWENVGKQVHTVTSGTLIEPANHFNSGLIAPNSFYSLEFAVEGIYPYYCMVHPWMSGSVVVGEKIDDEQKAIVNGTDIIILQDGQFQNATGVYWANGTAVIPEFPFAIIVLTVAITAVLITQRTLTKL